MVSILLHIRDWISRPLWTKCHHAELYYQMPSFYLSRKLSKYWWSYRRLQFPALIIFSTPDFVVPGMWTNLYIPNSFVFVFLLCFIVLFLFIHHLHIILLPCQAHHSSVLVSCCPRLLTCTSSYIYYLCTFMYSRMNGISLSLSLKRLGYQLFLFLSLYWPFHFGNNSLWKNCAKNGHEILSQAELYKLTKTSLPIIVWAVCVFYVCKCRKVAQIGLPKGCIRTCKPFQQDNYLTYL